MMIKNSLFIVLGVFSGLFFGQAFYLQHSPYVRGGGYDIRDIKDIISSDPYKGFCPDVNNKFWSKLPFKPARFDELQTYSALTSPISTLTAGTEQLCFYPEDTHWIKDVERSLSYLLDEETWEREFNSDFLVGLKTTSAVAVIANTISTLEPILDPELVRSVKARITARVIVPFLRAHNDYQDNNMSPIRSFSWLKANTNWKAVCTANIVYAGLALVDDIDTKARLVQASLDIMPEYLESFELDGYFSGGIRYWDYGFGHFVILAQRLLQASSGKINLYDHPKVSKAVEYPFLTSLMSRGGFYNFIYPVFGDNSNNVNNPVREDIWIWEILSRRYSLPYPPLDADPWEARLLGTYALLSPYKVDLLPEQKPKIMLTEPTFYPSGQLYIVRAPSKGMYLAAKGGNNNEEHNHNDVGSYSLFFSNRRFVNVAFGDLGVEEYQKGHFKGSERYTHEGMGSHGHPLPIVGNTLQSKGAESRAKLLSNSTALESGRIVYNLTDCYDVLGLKNVVRKLDFSDGVLTVTDSFESAFPVSFETIIPTYLSITKGGNPMIFEGYGDTFSVSVESSCDFSIGSRPSVYFPMAQFVRFSFKEPKMQGYITYKIKKNSPL